MASGPNPQQLETIETTDGPVLIIAGPGSGKTFTVPSHFEWAMAKSSYFFWHGTEATFWHGIGPLRALVYRLSDLLPGA